MAAQPEHQIRAIRSVIVTELQRVAIEHGRTLVPLADEVRLLELGLDSLGLAIVIARLEEALKVDPFASGEFIESPATFGEFVRMYERALPRVA
jgi:acyl carrier protein